MLLYIEKKKNLGTIYRVLIHFIYFGHNEISVPGFGFVSYQN